MRNHPIYVPLILILSLIFYIILGMMGDVRSEIEKYWLIIIPIYFIYFISILYVLNDRIPENIPFLFFILIGVLFRVALMPSEPFLSDDVYRYLWDGKIFAAGINPYKLAPVDIQLLEYRDQIIFPNINFPEIATSYPPVSQLLFWINYWFGGSILSWKILLLITEITLLVILLKLVRHFKLNKNRVLIYFFNPLLIIETYSSGHLEIAGVLLFWAAVLFFYKRYDWKCITLLSLSVMTKFLSITSGLPFLLNKFFKKSGLLILICLILLLPFSIGGIIPLPGLFSYVNRWEFNGGLYQLVISILKILDVKEYHWMVLNISGYSESFYISYGFYYKLGALLVLIIVFIDQMIKLKVTSLFRSINYIQRSFIFTAVFLLLTPTLHPWYLIWIIPFLIFIPNLSWIGFTFLIQASYFVLKDYSLSSEWNESIWVLLFQYLPFYVILIWEYLDRRRINSWFVF